MGYNIKRADLGTGAIYRRAKAAPSPAEVLPEAAARHPGHGSTQLSNTDPRNTGGE